MPNKPVSSPSFPNCAGPVERLHALHLFELVATGLDQLFKFETCFATHLKSLNHHEEFLDPTLHVFTHRQQGVAYATAA